MTDLDRLAGLLAELDLEFSPSSLNRLLRLRDELLRWNQRINLTAITDPEEALEKHLVDSLTLLPFIKGNPTFLDIGSGGGFPCLPLKIVQQTLPVWSVDSIGKKIAFQNHMARDLGLDNFVAVQVRAEKIGSLPGWPRFEMIVSRAFSSIATFLKVANPLLADKGQVVAMKGAEAERELLEATEEVKKLGFVCSRKESILLPKSRSARALLFFSRS